MRRLLPLLLPLALLGSGCSSLRESVSGPPAPPPVLRLEVVAPDALATLLREYLDLARVNRLAAGEPLPEGELDRLAAAAPQQVRDLLDTEGYFNAEITIERLGGAPTGAVPAGASPVASTGALPDASPGAPADLPDASPAAVPGTAPGAPPAVPPTALPGVRIVVVPGPRTLVGRVDVQTRGPIVQEADVEGTSTQAHARQTRRSFIDGWPLPAGTPFRDADWSRAKTASMASLRAQGYVQADWLSTQAQVDAATQRADIAVTANSGPLFLTGPLQVRGLKTQDEQTVLNIADMDTGAPATEVLLLDIQERLQTSDLFDRATVTLRPDPANPQATPVRVQLGERKLQEATVGVGISANVGPRLTIDHVHRRPFGRAWIARNKIDLADRQRRFETELSTQTLPGLYRNLVGGGVERVQSDTDLVTSSRLRVGRAQDTRRIDRQLFAEYQHSTTTSALGRVQADALALQLQGVWRKLDDQLLPTRGRAFTGQFGLGAASSKPGKAGPFGRIYGRVDAYRPLGTHWFGQARIELGEVLVNDDVQVPEALRFRAGGDESVRGYEYRSLTSQVNGVDVGGKVLFTASVEVARPLLASFPQLWGAVFIDAGRAAMSWSELKPAVGTGVGLRYRSPVGPVKLDLAWGQEERRVRLHLSVGVAF